MLAEPPIAAVPPDIGRRALFRLEGVGKTFQMGEMTVEALRDVSLEVFEREFLLIIGPSGSGKTTILNLIGGMDTVTAGRIWYRQQLLSGFNPAS